MKNDGFQVYKFSEMTNRERKLYKRHIKTLNEITELYSHFDGLSNDRKALYLFMNGKRLTVKRFWMMAGTTELRKCVSNLREKGYNIRSERVPGENFHIYWLEK